MSRHSLTPVNEGLKEICAVPHGPLTHQTPLMAEDLVSDMLCSCREAVMSEPANTTTMAAPDAAESFAMLEKIAASPPPTYDASTTPFTLRINFKQACTAADTAAFFPETPLWSRLLGIALAREWLHSSGISSTYDVPVTPLLSFEEVDNQIRARFQHGAHGAPWKRLQWVYVLRGKWESREEYDEVFVLDAWNWEEGKRLMLGMLDVRVDLVFVFSSEVPGRELPPVYGEDEKGLHGSLEPRSRRAEESEPAEPGAAAAGHGKQLGLPLHYFRGLLRRRRTHQRRDGRWAVQADISEDQDLNSSVMQNITYAPW